MRPQATLTLIGWCAACLLTGSAALAAVEPDLPLRGLALHRETGRDIYLGGLYLGTNTSVETVDAAGPRLMEYRIVARRTSIRSLLGGMLLQSEVASGHPPDGTTREFAAAVLAAVRGSLYAGDILGIMLSGDNSTAAYLNGHEITRLNERSVADYLLLGWIGEQGPATAFRDAMLAPDLDPALRANLQANSWSAQRGAEVAAWLDPLGEAAEDSPARSQPAAAQPAERAVPAAGLPAATKTRKTVATASAAPTATAQDFERVAVSAIPMQPLPRAAPEPAAKTRQPSTLIPPPQEQMTQPPGDVRAGARVAAPIPDPSPLPPEVPEGAAALDVKEYSRRLAEFNTLLMKTVYSQIHYPGRAVRRGMEGRLELDVVLNETGALLDVSVAKSSGFPVLDEAAIKAARKALADNRLDAADPVVHAEYGDADNRLVIPVPVNFRLTDRQTE